MQSSRSKVAAIQMVSGPDVQANLAEADRLIGQAADEGAELVVLPENFSFVGERDKDVLALRESDGSGPIQDFLATTAARHRVWLVGGTIPLAASDASRVRAACLVMDDEGKRRARYDKIHLFDVRLPKGDEQYQESSIIEPGDEVVVLDSPFGRLGTAVCYDLRFPELFRAMLDRGLEIVALPASFTAVTGKAHWETLVRARAIENLACVVAAGQGGHHVNGRETHGHSMVVDSWGAVLGQVPLGAGHLCCDLDLGLRDRVRRSFPAIEHRRLPLSG